MLDDCMSTQIPLSVAGSESTHTKRLLTGISSFDFKNAGDHTPISPFTIMGKDFHLKWYESVYDPHQHSRNCAILRPTFAISLPLPLATWGLSRSYRLDYPVVRQGFGFAAMNVNNMFAQAPQQM